VKNGPVAGSDEHFALRPGMFATVDLETSRKERVVVVPISAVQTVGPDTVVFVLQAAAGQANEAHHSTFERRVVVAGERDSCFVEIVKGLKAGEQVVVENAFLLKSELEKSRIGEGD
jgi:cobalt-zinc-cadmium efflux system membrane fusion protein